MRRLLIITMLAVLAISLVACGATAPTRTDGGANCDPNYEGQCLDPDAYDYDCEGGSGDGPKYTGLVRIVGDDTYDLDRDGDGVACEPY